MAQLMSIKKNVDVQPGVGVPAIFHCSQGDKGTRIILGLLNNNDNYTIPEGTTAIIRGSRADGTLFTEITADIDTTTEIKFNLTEDMTSVAGLVECEAVMTSGSANIIGTANFIINVEKSPASIGSVFPGTDAATTWLIDKLENEPLNSLNGESVVDAINGGSGSGLTEDVKVALLACFENVAWINEDGQDYYDALYDALYPPVDLVSISAVYTQSGTVYDTDTLDSLKSDLVVTAHMSDSSTQTVTSYTLSGTLTEGTSTITVSYGGKTTTFTVTVSHASDPSEQWTNGVAYTPTVIQDKYIEKSTGRIKDYTGWDWTGYLPCKGAVSVEVPKLGNVSDTESNALFDESFGVVQNAVGLYKNNYTSIKIPASAAYIGLSQARSVLAQVIEGGIIPYAAGTESNMTEWADGVEYEDISIITDTYLNNGIETSYTGWDATGFIPCNGATSLTIPPMPQQSSGVWCNSFYDRDHEGVSVGLTLSTTESVTVTVPASAHYFRLSSDRGALSSCISGGIVPNR